jgi:hypothetical protein
MLVEMGENWGGDKLIRCKTPQDHRKWSRGVVVVPKTLTNFLERYDPDFMNKVLLLDASGYTSGAGGE